MTRLQDFLNSRIADVSQMRVAPKAGDMFGVELECEGFKVHYTGEGDDPRGILKDWAPHNDGSLRAYKGNPACEWVFNGPVKYKKAQERVSLMFNQFEDQKARLVPSNRCSTHVHFNMGDKTAYQLVNMFILFTILEDLLDRYCGEDRNGNVFCLSSRHAEQQVKWMEDACFKNYSFANIREEWRYCSFNFSAINKFGTVEFRGMRGLDNEEAVLDWLSIINEFCDYACYKMRNPVTLVEEVSQKTPAGFLREIFSKENVRKLTNGLEEHEISASMFEGLRLVQMLCYRIGTEFDQVRLRGRDFWASLKEDAEPELDIRPEDFGAPRRRGARLERAVPNEAGLIFDRDAAERARQVMLERELARQAGDGARAAQIWAERAARIAPEPEQPLRPVPLMADWVRENHDDF